LLGLLQSLLGWGHTGHASKQVGHCGGHIQVSVRVGIGHSQEGDWVVGITSALLFFDLGGEKP